MKKKLPLRKPGAAEGLKIIPKPELNSFQQAESTRVTPPLDHGPLEDMSTYAYWLKTHPEASELDQDLKALEFQLQDPIVQRYQRIHKDDPNRARLVTNKFGGKVAKHGWKILD